MFADRVKETSITVGTGDFTGLSAIAGFDRFQNAFSVNDKVYYVIEHGAEWEVGIGTLTASTTLQRDTVLQSSNSDALVSFGTGTKIVFCAFPADEANNVRSFKKPVDLATTANITLSGEQTIDGTLTSTSRVLVKNQSTASQNGCYTTAAGAWTRTNDFAIGTSQEGSVVLVKNGTANNGKFFFVSAGDVVATDNLTWKQVQGSGLQNVVEDTTPQWGGNVDVNGFYLKDTNGNELLTFTATASAVNYVDLKNNSTTNMPVIAAKGDDANIDLELLAKGTGAVKAKSAYAPWVDATDAATVDFDIEKGTRQRVTITANRVLAANNVKDGQAFVVKIKQGGVGSFTVTWWANIKWQDDTEPTLTTTAGKADTFGFIKDGSNYLGYILGKGHAA